MFTSKGQGIYTNMLERLAPLGNLFQICVLMLVFQTVFSVLLPEDLVLTLCSDFLVDKDTGIVQQGPLLHHSASILTDHVYINPT